MFTYADHADIVGVNTVFGRQPQEPAAEQEGLGEVGHGYWDEAHVGAQLQQWTASPCGGCGRKLALTLKGSNKCGVGSGTLNFVCAKCDHEYPLQRSRNVVTGIRGRPTEENTVRFISACLGVGLGHSATNTLLSGANLPQMCTSTFHSVSRKTGVASKSALEVEREKNLAEEIRLTLLYEGDAAYGADGKVMIRVITDGSWQKRYGHNSLWGYGVMCGFYTGKVVFVSHRCARCQTCSMAAHKGLAPPEHNCTKNWDEKAPEQGAPGNMEKDIALEGVTQLFEEGAIVHSLVCDGDTKTLEWIKLHGPAPVAKVIDANLDLNHIAKNFGKKLRELMPLVKLKEVQCAALQRAFTRAVYDTRDEAPEDKGAATWDEGAAIMQGKMMSNMDYYFGKGDTFHSARLKNTPIPLDKYDAVKSLFVEYSTIPLCTKLLFKCSTNTCESGNGVLWCFHLPKTFLQPSAGGMHLDWAQLHKGLGRQAAGLAIQGQLGLPPPCALVAAQQANTDDRNKRYPPS